MIINEQSIHTIIFRFSEIFHFDPVECTRQKVCDGDFLFLLVTAFVSHRQRLSSVAFVPRPAFDVDANEDDILEKSINGRRGEGEDTKSEKVQRDKRHLIRRIDFLATFERDANWAQISIINCTFASASARNPFSVIHFEWIAPSVR